MRHDNPEGLSLDVSFPSCGSCASRHPWGALSMKLSAGFDPTVAVAVSASKICAGEGELGGDNVSDVSNSSAPSTPSSPSTSTSSSPYRLVVTAQLPSEVRIDASSAGGGGNNTKKLTVREKMMTLSLSDAALTLTHEAPANAASTPLPAFNALEWNGVITGVIDVSLPSLRVTATGAWVKSFVISGGKTSLASKKEFLVDDGGDDADAESTTGGDKIELNATMVCSDRGVDVKGDVQISVPGGAEGTEIFAGEARLSLDMSNRLTVAEVRGTGTAASQTHDSQPSVEVDSIDVSVSLTYGTSVGAKMNLEGTGGTMEIGTVPSKSVEISIEMSDVGGGGAAMIVGTLEGKVQILKDDGDAITYAGVPDLTFKYLRAGVAFEILDAMRINEVKFVGKVSQVVEGKTRNSNQAIFNVQGELEFDFPCVGKASGDMLAWGEIPNVVLMHDTNVTFEYDCDNARTEKPTWTISGGSEEPYAATTLYLGSKDFVELESLKVQGLAYRKSIQRGDYVLSNLFFGVISKTGDPNRPVGSRASFSYHTDDDRKLREIEAARHTSPHLNATMMFRHMDESTCDDIGVIGTARVSLLLGVEDACGVNTITKGRLHATRRCGTPAKEYGTYVLTTDGLSGGTVNLVQESGFLIEISSASLRLTGKNPSADTWNAVALHQQQANAGGGKEALVDPTGLQWAGKINGQVYVSVPRAHHNLRMFGTMSLKFRIKKDGPEIQSITAELEVSYPLQRKDLPFWLRMRLKEHDACNQQSEDKAEEEESLPDSSTKSAEDTKKKTLAMTLFDSSKFREQMTSSWTDEEDDAPVLDVVGNLTLTYPCAEKMKPEKERKCKKWDKSKKASECQDDDLMSGTGGLTMLWPKVKMDRATGAMGVECGVGGKLFATLTAASMSVGNVDMKTPEIKLYVQETDVNGTRAYGTVNGHTLTKDGTPAIAFFIYNDLSSDDFDKTAGRIRPAIRKVLDKDPLWMVFEAESKNPCPVDGNDLEGEMRWMSRKYQKPGTRKESDRDDYNLVDEVYGEAGKGKMYCRDPGNATLLRFDMTTKVRTKGGVFIAGGQLRLIKTKLSAKGYGSHNVPLSSMVWEIELSGEIESTEDGSAFGIWAPGAALVSATRSPATQEFTRPEFWVNVELYGWIGSRNEGDSAMLDFDGGDRALDYNHDKMFEFTAQIKYEFPCESKLTVPGTVSLDIEGGEVKDMEATVTVYCPGMSSCGRKAFRIAANHETELSADFGGMRNLKLSHLTIAVEGKDSRVISPDVNQDSWMPMASFAAVELEGTITARVVSGYNAEGSSQGLNVWFAKAAGAAAPESKMSMVEVFSFDFETDGLEVHLTGELEKTCTPMGSKIVGYAKIDKPGIFICDMNAEAVIYSCDPEASPQVEIVAEVALARIPAIFVALENVAFHVKIYNAGDPNGTEALINDTDTMTTTADDATQNSTTALLGDDASGGAPAPAPAPAPSPGPASESESDSSAAATDSGKMIVTKFEGTLKLEEELLSKFPALPGMDSMSIFASGQFTTGTAAGFSLDDLKVKINVGTEFGAGSRVDGLVVFTYPCEKIIGRLNVELRAPLPHMDAEAKLTAYCGGDIKGFELEFTISDLEIAPSVTFSLVTVFLGVTKEESFSDMWAINATVTATGNSGGDAENREAIEAGTNGDAGRMKWRGRLMFWTGPTEVPVQPEIIPEVPPPALTELLPILDRPPPPYTKIPPAPLGDDCCNGLDDASVPEGKCCNPGTLKLLPLRLSMDGHEGPLAACVYSKWCDMPELSDCTSSAKLIPVTKTCSDASAVNLQPPGVAVPPLEPAAPAVRNPPTPPPQLPTLSEAKTATCCNANGADYALIEASHCCDSTTLTIVEGGKQCTSNRWCKSGDCVKAVKIAKGAECSNANRGRHLLLDADSAVDAFTSPGATPKHPDSHAPRPSNVDLCCNANDAESLKNIKSTQCCDQSTLKLVDGGTQCHSTRWCRAKDCKLGDKVDKTATCASVAAALEPTGSRSGGGGGGAPPQTSEKENNKATPKPPTKPPAALCCNPNNAAGLHKVKSTQCCDQDTLTLVDGGAQCVSSQWCNMKDCVAALAIKGAETCDGGSDSGAGGSGDDKRAQSGEQGDDAALDEQSTNRTDDYVNTNSNSTVEEEEYDDKEDLKGNMTFTDEVNAAVDVEVRIERTYQVEAEVDVLYDDGNVELEFHGELVVGEMCDEYQLLADAKLKIATPPVTATGDVAVSCPDDGGGRNLSLNVTLWEWQITDGIKVVDGSLQLNVTKAGGSSGTGAGVGLVGTLTGGVVIDQDAIPSAANGNFEMEVSLMVEIEFSKKSCQIVLPEEEDRVAEDDVNKSAAAEEVEGGGGGGDDAESRRRRRLLQAQEEATAGVKSEAARAMEEECKLKLDSVDVEIEFSVQKNQAQSSSAQNSSDVAKPLFKVDGKMHFVYPCGHGDTAEAEATLELNVGEYSVPDFTVEMVFYCGRGCALR